MLLLVGACAALAACDLEGSIQGSAASTEVAGPATTYDDAVGSSQRSSAIGETDSVTLVAAQQMQEPPPPALLAAWGPLGALAGRYWVLLDQGTAEQLYFDWEDAGSALVYSGLDRDGNILAGRYMIDPATSEMAGLSIYRGEAYEQSVAIEAQTFVITTRSGAEPARARYTRVGVNGYRVEREVFRGGRWRQTRVQGLAPTSRAMVQALGWEARSAELEAAEAAARARLFERRPSFFSRLGSAFQAGVTTGVEEGVREGVRDETRRAITGNRPPAATTYDTSPGVTDSAGETSDTQSETWDAPPGETK